MRSAIPRITPSADLKGKKQFVNGHDRLWDAFNDYTSKANITDVSKHFPQVGSSFGYVIVDKRGHDGLSFSDGADTSLGFLPCSGADIVKQKLHMSKNLDALFKIDQKNSPDVRVSIPMTRALDAGSIEILDGPVAPTKGSDKPSLYLYVHAKNMENAKMIRDKIVDCIDILNKHCKWVGFINIKVVRMIAI